jgi:hypothetical protein
MRLLLTEDDPRLADCLHKALGENGHVVDLARNGIAGRRLALDGDHALVLLDIMLLASCSRASTASACARHCASAGARRCWIQRLGAGAGAGALDAAPRTILARRPCRSRSAPHCEGACTKKSPATGSCRAVRRGRKISLRVPSGSPASSM